MHQGGVALHKTFVPHDLPHIQANKEERQNEHCKPEGAHWFAISDYVLEAGHADGVVFYFIVGPVNQMERVKAVMSKNHKIINRSESFKRGKFIDYHCDMCFDRISS
jgi:hypothetical protein